MSDLQELIFRGRFVIGRAPARLQVLEALNGRRNTRQIATLFKRHVNNVRRDLAVLEDAGLIQPVVSADGPLRRDGLPVYEKVPLVRTIPSRYFVNPATAVPLRSRSSASRKPAPKAPLRRPPPLKMPSEADILAMANAGESQTLEFKAQGTDVKKITREIAAMLNTRQGGVLLYGVEDDGTIQGSGTTLQKFDQPLQNSIRNTVAPSATVRAASVKVLGTPVIAIVVPPWNRRDVYQYEGRVLLRRGTNVFTAKPEEVRRLHTGQYIT